jgi:predicted transposase/invertase (TIGR01784 family)
MQKAAQHYFRDRAVFYSTFLINEQAPQGGWNYALQSVYFVAILNFTYDEQEDQQKFFREVSLKDQDGDEFYNKLYYHFYQMPLFTKTESELRTRKDKWFYFLKNLESFDDIPMGLRESVFERAFAIAEECRLSPKERARYMHDLKVYRDNYAVMDTARFRGFQQGLAEGEAKGLAEGEAKKARETARNMLKDGFDITLIGKYTGLSQNEIERLG